MKEREHGGERPRRELTPQQTNSVEQAGPQEKSAAHTPVAPLVWERQSGEERSHAELVSAFRGLIRKEQLEVGDRARFFPPVKIIRAAFSKQVQYIFSDDKGDKQRGAFFGQILDAWDVIAYERYDEELSEKHHAGLNLDTKYNRAKARHAPHPEIITLEDPLQVRIIDAAAEAVGVPHQRGQTAFEIPAKLWNYSEEVHKANEAWRRRMR